MASLSLTPSPASPSRKSPAGLSLDTINLNLSPSPNASGWSELHKAAGKMTPLPSPIEATFAAGSSSGGRRTNGFFNSPVAVQPPTFARTQSSSSSNRAASRSPTRASAKDTLRSDEGANQRQKRPELSDTPISGLPSAVLSSPPRSSTAGPSSNRKSVASALGLGGSPKHARQDTNGVLPHVALHPPSRYPTLLGPRKAPRLERKAVLTPDEPPPRSTSPVVESPSTFDAPHSSVQHSTVADDSDQTETDAKPGTTLSPDYQVVRLLGTGAFSQVVLARRTQPGKREENEAFANVRQRRISASMGEGVLVAIKVIDRRTCEANDRMRISVLREVEVLQVKFCYFTLL